MGPVTRRRWWRWRFGSRAAIVFGNNNRDRTGCALGPGRTDDSDPPGSRTLLHDRPRRTINLNQLFLSVYDRLDPDRIGYCCCLAEATNVTERSLKNHIFLYVRAHFSPERIKNEFLLFAK